MLGAICGIDYSSTKYKYDTNHRLIEISRYLNNRMDSRGILSYDSSENLIEEDFGHKKTTYKYDKNNQMIEEINPPEKITYKYDLNGNQIEITTYWNGELYDKISRKYNDKKNLTEETIFTTTQVTENGEYGDETIPENTTKKTYKYDGNGNQIEFIEENSNGYNEKVTNSFTLDNKNNIIKQIIYRYDKPSEIIENIYNY